MARLVLVCGPTEVGKTTYSLSLAKEIEASNVSINAIQKKTRLFMLLK
jgi:tRNA A37 N6-isopentenylltransferase MiaA